MPEVGESSVVRRTFGGDVFAWNSGVAATESAKLLLRPPERSAVPDENDPRVAKLVVHVTPEYWLAESNREFKLEDL